MNFEKLHDKDFASYAKKVAKSYFLRVKGESKYFKNAPFHRPEKRSAASKDGAPDFLFGLVYSPNIYVMTYLLEAELDREVVVDYGCGMGCMSVLMKHFGIEVFCYDDFSQVNGEMTLQFLEEFGVKGLLLGKDEVVGNATIITGSGIAIRDEDFISKPLHTIVIEKGRFVPEVVQDSWSSEDFGLVKILRKKA